MSKTKSAFFCQSCGYETPKWLGKCPACSSWNSFVEEPKIKKGSTAPFSKNSTDAKPVVLQDITKNEKQKSTLKDQELNRVLGGGVVLGSLILVGGDPGI
jgi:DNA repair protein RadA/Sms